MDVEILIHGVPKGQDYYGIEEERSNVELYYTESNESEKFVVETKKTNSKSFAHYSYLRYKNVLDSEGRPGSYFGVTLRIDKYYQDARHIYAMLEMIFKKYVIGTILTTSGANYKYNCLNFESKKANIDQLKQGLILLMQNTCLSSKFMDLDATLIHPIQKAVACNIQDANDDAVLMAIKQYSKVILSSEYKTAQVIDLEKKLVSAEQSSNNAVANSNKRVKELEDKNTELKTKVSNLENQLNQQKTENQRFQKESKLAEQIKSVKDPIESIAKYFSQFTTYESNHEEKKTADKTPLLMVINSVLTLIVVILCFILLFKVKPVQNEGGIGNNPPAQVTTPIVSPEQPKEVKSDTTEEQKAAERRAAEEQKAAERRAAEEQKAAERRAAEEKKAVERKAAEKAKQAEAEKAKQAEAEKAKQAEAEKAKQAEAEKTKQAEAEKAKQAEAEKAKQAEEEPVISVDRNVTKVRNREQYTFSVSYSGDGKWGLDGFTYIKGGPSDKTITVKISQPSEKANGAHIISYSPNGGEKVFKRFEEE